jgi:hypothetical protein
LAYSLPLPCAEARHRESRWREIRTSDCHRLELRCTEGNRLASQVCEI